MYERDLNPRQSAPTLMPYQLGDRACVLTLLRFQRFEGARVQKRFLAARAGFEPAPSAYEADARPIELSRLCASAVVRPQWGSLESNQDLLVCSRGVDQRSRVRAAFMWPVFHTGEVTEPHLPQQTESVPDSQPLLFLSGVGPRTLGRVERGESPESNGSVCAHLSGSEEPR